MNDKITLRAKKITKIFPGGKALDNFSFKLRKGEIHGLLGKNGAGKSTFIKILNGLYKQDTGEIFINNKKIKNINPILSLNLGLKFIHQELNVFPHLSIMDNIFMNNYYYKPKGFISWKKVFFETKKILEDYKINVSPYTKIEDLDIGKIQLIEIISAITKKAKIIIMDEPTSSLGRREKEKLFSTLKVLKSKNISIIYITHVLEEVLNICDRATVLRDGKLVGTFKKRDFSRDFLVEKIVGQKVKNDITDIEKKSEKKLKNIRTSLSARNLGYKNILNNVSFDANYGEILCILGLMGAGKSEIANIIFGLIKDYSGNIYINGNIIKELSPVKSIKNSLGFVTEDRKRSGIFYHMSVMQNCSIVILKNISKLLGIINLNKEKEIISKIVKKLSISTPNLKQKVKYLSGGNQQKVVLGKWLAKDQDILILDEPTKGIDVSTRTEFYNILLSLRNSGKSVILLTSDYEEVYSISDRILLLKKGEVKKTLYRKNHTPSSLLAELVSN